MTEDVLQIVLTEIKGTLRSKPLACMSAEPEPIIPNILLILTVQTTIQHFIGYFTQNQIG